MLSVINGTGGRGAYKYQTGEISPVEIAIAGMGYKKIRFANLPPEVLDDILRAALAPFGQVLDIQNEMWVTVENGVRQVNMMLTQHVPSHLVIAGQRVLISYDGQPTSCYGCGDTEHLYPICSCRQRRAPLSSPTTPVTFATVAATMPQSSGDQPGDNIHGDSPHLLERVVESNNHNVDAPRTALNAALPPWTRIRTRSWGTPTPPNLTAPEHPTEPTISLCQRSLTPWENERRLPAKARD